MVDKDFEEKNARHKSKNLSKSLSIIYGLQTSLDFDKALEIQIIYSNYTNFVVMKSLKGLVKKLKMEF